MKMGLITSIFETLTLEQVIDFAAETGLECLEVACWPSSGGAKRRYAGTCHIDAQALTKARADEINAYLAKKRWPIIPTPWIRTWKSAKPISGTCGC